MKFDRSYFQSAKRGFKLRYILIWICCSFVSIHSTAQSVDEKVNVSFSPVTNAFPLISGSASSLYVDPSEPQVVKIAAEAFSNDVSLVSGQKLSVKESRQTGTQVIIGTLGTSKILQELISKRKLDLSDIQGKWESFKICIIDNPFPNVPQALVIAGSDRRGTAFGVFELSRLIGVHPFNWWADIRPEKHDRIFISGSYSSNSPSVKYRGIFLNDEDWGLQPWAAKTFEPETGDIGPKTYAKIFELLLRLKANLIWPAMHPSTKAFYHYPGNKKVADDYAILVGTSHAEPMLRNNVDEWDEKTMGRFNYQINKPVIFKYWEDRVKETSSNEVMFSMGMRGVHDSGMEGVKSVKEAAPLLERIIEDQRSLLSKYVNKNVAVVPQVFTAYKEVLDIYDSGLKIPEDITLIWPDDNYGYIHRLNNEAEKQRAGSSGVYYHASYWGRPHDYLWLSSTHPALIREEMMKAYETKSDRVWVLNVGDIKPLEYNIQMFLDMAYNATPFQESSYSQTHLFNWASSVFGEDKADDISQILWQYYDLAFERRPEFMGWSQTEPTTQTRYSDYNHFYYGDEGQRRIDAYQSLENEVKRLRSEIQANDADAFFQLVYYPVVGASYMNKKFLYRDKAFLYAQQNRVSALDYAKMSQAAYDSIRKETDFYNNSLAGGKWKHMMSMAPRGLPVFKEPVLADIKIDDTQVWGIAPEGWVKKDSSLVAASADELSLPVFNTYFDNKYFVDVFLSKETALNWTASTKDKWIRISEQSGTLNPQKNESRIWISIDPASVPAKEHFQGTVTFAAGKKKIRLSVPVFNPPASELKNFAGFVENDGLISIKASSFSKQTGAGARKWTCVEGLGRSGNVMMAQPFLSDVSSINQDSTKSGPVLEYDFYSFSNATPEVKVFTLPTHPLNNLFSNRYAVSIDNGPLTVLDFKTVGRSAEWKQNVLQNQAVRSFKAGNVGPGKHTLKIYMIDPGVAVDRILIDLGGLKQANSVIPETVKLKKSDAK